MNENNLENKLESLQSRIALLEKEGKDSCINNLTKKQSRYWNFTKTMALIGFITGVILSILLLNVQKQLKESEKTSTTASLLLTMSIRFQAIRSNYDIEKNELSLFEADNLINDLKEELKGDLKSQMLRENMNKILISISTWKAGIQANENDGSENKEIIRLERIENINSSKLLILKSDLKAKGAEIDEIKSQLKKVKNWFWLFPFAIIGILSMSRTISQLSKKHKNLDS